MTSSRFRLIVGVLIILTGCAPAPIPAIETVTILPTFTSSQTITPRPTPSATVTRFPTATATLTPEPCDPSESFCVVTGHFIFLRPIDPTANVKVDKSYRYGTTMYETLVPHHGVDIPNAAGTPVIAAADGQVVYAGDDSQTIFGLETDFYGNLIILEHRRAEKDMPIYSLYAHLSKIDVQSGEKVKAGETIGEVGLTGSAIGAHLHFEVRVGGAIPDYASTRNPELWLKPLPDTGVLAGRLIGAQSGLTIHVRFNLYDPAGGVYDGETYMGEVQHVNSDDVFGENLVVGELAPGRYRLTFKYENIVYERYVEIEAGKLTLFTVEIGK
jgi:hypothetical protein